MDLDVYVPRGKAPRHLMIGDTPFSSSDPVVLQQYPVANQ